MQRLKQFLGYLCILECVFCIVMFNQIPKPNNNLMVVGLVCFAMYAYYLLKKTPNKVSAIRIYFGVGCLGICIGMLCFIFNPIDEQTSFFVLLLASILFGILSFWLLNGFKRRTPAEKDTKQQLNDAQFYQTSQPIHAPINNTANSFKTPQPADKIEDQAALHIESNTLSAKPEYNQLDANESMFFSALSNTLVANGISPAAICLTRLSSGVFNVNSPHAYIGKVDVRLNRRKPLFIQYFEPAGNMREIFTDSLQECIEVIPAIVNYITYTELGRYNT